MTFAYTIDEPDAPTAAFILRRLSRFFPGAVPQSSASAKLPAVELSSHCPLLDEQLLADMVATAVATGQTYVAVDAIPGSEPIRVGYLSGTKFPFFSRMQNLYCTNFNVGRPNRLKIFTELCNKFDDLAERSLLDILAFLESEEGVDFVVAYGEPVTLTRYDKCPSCEVAPPPQSLHSGTSHPITGFLTKNTTIYSHCLQCGLTYLNRQMPREELWRYYQGHSYANAESDEEIESLFNSLGEANVSHYANYIAVMKYITPLPHGAAIADLGAGKGEFAVMAKRASPTTETLAFEWRFDDVITRALERRQISTISGDIQKAISQHKSRFDIVSAWEVIEHLKLEDFRKFLEDTRNALKDGGYFIFSTPDFENPYTMALDMWAMAPGEHISVFSRRFLEPLLNKARLTIVEEMHESVTLKLPNAWFAFGERTNVHFSSKGSAAIINDFLEDDVARERVRQNARDKNLGSELILVCRAQ